MLNNLTKTLVKYKMVVLIGGFLVVIVVGVFIFSKVVYSSKVDVQVSVKPTLNLGPCFNNQKPPKASIVSPAEGSKYTNGDKVAISGLAVLECDNSKIEDKDLSWYLDSDSSPFAQGLTYSLEGLKAGDHKIRLVALSGKLKGEAFVNIRFDDAKPLVLGVTAPPPAPPAAPKVDNPPQIKIVSVGKAAYIPGDPFAVTAPLNDSGDYSISLDIVASVQDEDSNLIPIWTIGGNEAGRGNTLSYTFSMTPEARQGCQTSKDFPIVVSVVDSKQQPAKANFVLQLRGECAAGGNSLLDINLNLQLGL